ncbi:MAG: TatD family hydrolase [Candidatus Nanopelagicaceae bacterium]
MADRHNRDIDRPPAPLPAPLGTQTVDSHAHLELVFDGAQPDDPRFAGLLAECASVGIDRIVQVGYSAEQSRWCAEFADYWPRTLAAVALHPNEAPVVEDLEKELAVIESLAARSRVRAIGETGLDFFRTPPELQEKQKYSFRRHIDIAKRYKKALVIHDRDAHREVLDLLKEEGAPEITVFHCFSGDEAMARECIEAGYYLSFAGTVTFKNAPELRSAAALCPPDLLLVETDSPFLCPMPNRGLLNTPAQIPNTVRAIAHERHEEPDHVAALCSANAERVFGSFE